MRLRGALRSIRALATPATFRGIELAAGLTLVERVLTPAAAWIVLEGPFVHKVGVSFVLAAVFTLRGFVQRVQVARTEAGMFERVIRALVEGDVLRPNVLPGRDARSELAQGIYHAATAIGQDLPSLVADCVASAILTAVILALEPVRLVSFAVALTAVAAVAVVWSRGRLQQAARRAWAAQEAVFLAFVDAMEGRLEIVAAGRGDAFLEESRARTRSWSRAASRLASSGLVSGRLPLLAVAAAVAVVVAVSSRARGSLSITVADMALFASVTPAFAGVAQGVFALARAEHWMALVAEAVQWPVRVEGGTTTTAPARASVAFERVSFEYGGATSRGPALSEVSFAWRPGQVLALAGPNGSGKSTCLRLLLGLAPPTAGAITLDGVDLRELDVEAWRRSLAFLPQRAYMPPQANVGSAIRFLAPGATDAAILMALERVGLLDALRRLGPDPLAIAVDTLSIGERQRVAIARLLCREAAVILLDEPDANLDRAGIALCARLVRELSQHAMVAFAAHTPELLHAADLVVTLDRGRLVREGTA